MIPGFFYSVLRMVTSVRSQDFDMGKRSDRKTIRSIRWLATKLRTIMEASYLDKMNFSCWLNYGL